MKLAYFIQMKRQSREERLDGKNLAMTKDFKYHAGWPGEALESLGFYVIDFIIGVSTIISSTIIFQHKITFHCAMNPKEIGQQPFERVHPHRSSSPERDGTDKCMMSRC